MYRRSLILRLLVFCPLRRRNIVRARYGTGYNFYRDKEQRWNLNFTAQEMKTHRDLQRMLPQALTPYLDEWVAPGGPRDILLNAKVYGKLSPRTEWDDMAMFPLSGGRRMREGQLSKELPAWTYAAIGTAVHPHMARYTYATQILLMDDREIQTAADGLGDRPETVRQYYDFVPVQNRTDKANTMILDSIDKIRERHTAEDRLEELAKQLAQLPPDELQALLAQVQPTSQIAPSTERHDHHVGPTDRRPRQKPNQGRAA